jgi:hypothetical protein
MTKLKFPSTHNRFEIVLWCQQQFGPNGPTERWETIGMHNIIFRKDRDATMFILRWA